MILRITAPLFVVLACASGTNAQLPTELPGASAGIPDLATQGIGNAAGVLGYCMKNKLLGSAPDAGSVLDQLKQKPEAESSPDLAAGEAGNIQLGNGGSFSIDKAPKQLKSKACDMVLKQSKSLL